MNNDATKTMFCRQCQETFGNSGCTKAGVCGKQPRTAELMDELVARLEDLAAELKNKYTVIMVTHNMQQAARISDRTAFFLLGELVEFGKTEQVFSTPADKRTEDYITGRFG